VTGLSGCASPTHPAADRAVVTDSSGVASQAGAAPRFTAEGPDAEQYGARAGYPKGDRTTFWDLGSVVGSHSHLDEVFQGRLIRRAPAPSRLVRVVEPRITWTFEGADLTLDDYLARNPTTGLLIARGDTILVERYQYGRTDAHRFTSWSMAKTVTAMLVGVAIDEGRIRSVDDLAAAYVPELAGTEYGRTSLRHLLQMSSGVRFSENYGTKFSYASVETQVLGLVLSRAIGRPVAEYLEQKMWQPIGAEADATWLIDNSGQEATFCCLNAVLRDYARLGLLLAHDGKWRGRQVIPAAWLLDATTIRADQPHLRPGAAVPGLGYGYQTWILGGERRMFLLWGVRGQRIIVDPQSKLIMVNTAVHKRALDIPPLREMGAFWSAVVRQFGGV
jgi:CubicO group peptidase (beta-lactamase class C family)